MRIEEVQVDAYGALSGVNVRLDEGLNCLHGVNEAGKSTLLSFIRCVFFGFRCALTDVAVGSDQRTAPYDPVSGGTKGGHVVVVAEEDGRQVRYRFERKRTGRRLDGELVVEDLTRGRRHEGEDAPRAADRLLGGTKEQVFCHLFAVGPDELHAVRSLDQDEVRSALFTAEAGIGGDFVQAMRRLEKEEADLYLPRGKREINKVQGRLRDLDKKVREARKDLVDHEERWQELSRLDDQEGELEAQRKRMAASRERAKVRMQARGVLAKIKELEQEIAQGEDDHLPDEQALRQWDRMEERLEASDEVIAKTRAQVEKLEREREALRYLEADAEAWATLKEYPLQGLAGDLEAFREHEGIMARLGSMKDPVLDAQGRERVQGLMRERDERRRGQNEFGAQIEHLQEQIRKERDGLLSEEAAERAHRVRALDLDALDREMHGTRERLREKERRFDTVRGELGRQWTHERVARVDTDRSTRANVQAELARAGASEDLGGRSLLVPVSGVGLVLLGAALIVLRIMGPFVGAIVLAGGVVLLAVSGVQTGRSKRPGQEPRVSRETQRVLQDYGLPVGVTLEDFRALCDTLAEAKRWLLDVQEARDAAQQAKDRWEQAVQLVQQAARGVGVDLVDDPRETARRVVARLDASGRAAAHVQALETQWKEWAKKREDVERTLKQTEKELLAVCRSLGVEDPSDLSQAMQAGRERDELGSQARELASRAKRFQELRGVVDRVQHQRGDPPFSIEGFLTSVQALYTRCEEAYGRREEARQIAKSLEQKRREMVASVTARQEKRQEAQDLLREYSVSDEQGLRSAAQRAAWLKDLKREKEAQEGGLLLLEANHPELRVEAARIPPDEDQALLAGADDLQADLEKRLQDVRERQKTLHAQLSRAVTQDTMGDLLAQRKEVKEQWTQAVERWAQLRLTRFLLDEARREYEERHGPQVLKRAGEFLGVLTGGRYVKIRQLVDGGGYELVRPDGTRVPAAPPRVSRGTFAQVYLLVRLAFTDVMAQQRPLPYVLDDVLVDFDETRLQRALEILGEVAKGRQVVLLTHHGHVARAVKRSGGHVVRWEQPA